MVAEEDLNVIISMIFLLAKNLKKMFVLMNINARDVKAVGLTKTV